MLETKLTDIVTMQKEMTLIASMTSLAHWDQVVKMPKGAAGARSEVLTYLAKLYHEKKTSKEYQVALEKWIDLKSGEIKDDSLSDHEIRLLKLSRKFYNEAFSLPVEFVEEYTNACTHGEHAWEEAKNANDFKMFAPFLDRIIQLTKKKAEYLNTGETLYDSLIHAFEPGMSCNKINPIFEQLRNGTIEILNEVKKKNLTRPDFIFRHFPKVQQWEYQLGLIERMGMDPRHSRMDESEHPFSTNFHPSDVRITTHIKEDYFLDGLLSTMHEAGHALYELGMPMKWFGSTLCHAASFGIHESQSRFWENHIGRSDDFWQREFPLLKEKFKEQLADVDYQTFMAGVNYVEPSLIRIEADELTYNLHIMIRYELEEEIINGNIKIDELPERWNEKYQKYLGVSADTEAKGVLQDVHWSGGAFGYFPSYSLGNLYAAQMHSYIVENHNQLIKDVKSGNFLSTRQWLKDNVHQNGNSLSPEQLIEEVTGNALDASHFLNYARAKFLG